MIFNPTVIESSGGGTIETVSVSISTHGRYPATIRYSNGGNLESIDIPGGSSQTINVLKNSMISCSWGGGQIDTTGEVQVFDNSFLFAKGDGTAYLR